MQVTTSSTTGDLLAEISRLEDQITKLSSQLDSNHQTIDLLKKTLMERDSRIHLLESNLILTPKLLLQNGRDKIQRCRIQLQAGAQERFIHPVLAHVQQLIDLVQRLLNEANYFINKSQHIIVEHINSTVEIANKGPQQAKLYFEKNIIEPILSLVHQAIETSNQYIKSTQRFIGTNIITPSQSFYDQGIEAILALPSQTQIIFQVQLFEPALHTFNQLCIISHKLSEDTIALFKNLLAQLVKLIEQGLSAVAEQVKKSQFWDGKKPIEAMA
jgi:hypothetical protein